MDDDPIELKIPIARFSLGDAVVYKATKFVVAEMAYDDLLGIIYSLSPTPNQQPVETKVREAALAPAYS